jgi:cobalt-zinc-cadmium efflux system outer membrane protein
MKARAAFVFFLAGAAGSAATERPSDRYLSPSGTSIEKLVEAALASEPGLLAASLSVEAARAREQQADLRPNPTLAVSRTEEIGGTDNNTLIGFAWPLDLWRKSARVSSAERATDVAKAELEDRERLLAADVRLAAGDFLAAVRSLRVTEDRVDATRRLSELVSARVREGAAPPLENGIVAVERSRLESGRALSEARAEMALLEIKRVVGLMPEAELALAEDLENVVVVSAGTPMETTGIEARPDVKAADARVAAASARQELAVRGGRADASLMASYSRMDAGFPQQGFGPDGTLERVRGLFHRIELGVSWELPLRNGNEGEIAATGSEKAAAERESARVRLAGAAELAKAEAREVKVREALEIYARVIRQARDNLAVLRESYQLGRTALLDVIAEERRYLEIEDDYTEVLLEVYQAHVDWRRARGDIR